MKRLGITGGIGSGKSSVCKILERYGCAIFNSDDTAKHLQETDPEMISQIKTLFGEAVYDGNIPSRKKIAQIVFSDPAKLNALNKVIHPKVFKAFDDAILQANAQGKHAIVKEAAILFESGSEKGLDAVIVVTAPLATRIKRLVETRGISEADAIKRISNQLPEEELARRADYIIHNDGTIIDLEQKTKLVISQILPELKLLNTYV